MVGKRDGKGWVARLGTDNHRVCCIKGIDNSVQYNLTKLKHGIGCGICYISRQQAHMRSRDRACRDLPTPPFYDLPVALPFVHFVGRAAAGLAAACAGSSDSTLSMNFCESDARYVKVRAW